MYSLVIFLLKQILKIKVSDFSFSVNSNESNYSYSRRVFKNYTALLINL